MNYLKYSFDALEERPGRLHNHLKLSLRVVHWNPTKPYSVLVEDKLSGEHFQLRFSTRDVEQLREFIGTFYTKRHRHTWVVHKQYPNDDDVFFISHHN